MKFQEKINGHLIVINYADHLHELIQPLYQKLIELNDKDPGIRNGTIIRFGWTDLRIVEQENEFMVYEPDFNNNPLTDFIPQVTYTLDVLRHQIALLNKLDVEGLASLYTSKVILTKNILKEENLYLIRSEVEDENDSGWYIGKAKNNKEDDVNNLEVMYVFEIFQKRSELMQVLSLPIGYLIIFKDNEIEAILNAQNKYVYKQLKKKYE